MARIIAHRGHSIGAPEQTLAAFRAALEHGVTMLEADVRRTADDVLVLLHDGTVDRTTDGTGPIADLPLPAARALDAGSWFSPEFAGERIPTLEELFALVEEYDADLCLEVKGERHDETAALAIEVATLVRDRGRLDRDVLASFDHAALDRARIAVPGTRVGPDRLPERGPTSASALLAQARAIGAPVIQHHFADLDAETVARTQEEGVEVWAWPVNDPADIERMAAWGVAGIMGDDAEALARLVPSGRRR